MCVGVDSETVFRDVDLDGDGEWADYDQKVRHLLSG